MTLLMATEETLADVIHRVQRERGWTSTRLAEEIGASGPGRVSDWVRKPTRMQPEFMWRLAELAGISYEEMATIVGYLPREAKTASRERIIPRDILDELEDMAATFGPTVYPSARTLLRALREVRESQEPYESQPPEGEP